MRLTHLITIAALLAGAGSISAQQSTARNAVPGPETLAGLRNRARPVLVFAPSPEDPQMREQLDLFREQASALEERDAIVLAIPFRGAPPMPHRLATAESRSLRRRLGIGRKDFAVILVGKDGGEKFRSADPVSLQKICDLIDEMPMRRQEMRARPAAASAR